MNALPESVVIESLKREIDRMYERLMRTARRSGRRKTAFKQLQRAYSQMKSRFEAERTEAIEANRRANRAALKFADALIDAERVTAAKEYCQELIGRDDAGDMWRRGAAAAAANVLNKLNGAES